MPFDKKESEMSMNDTLVIRFNDGEAVLRKCGAGTDGNVVITHFNAESLSGMVNVPAVLEGRPEWSSGSDPIGGTPRKLGRTY